MLMELVFALFIGFAAAEIFALVRWRGMWRLAALMPVFIVSAIVIWIVIEPARHYLLAFELMVWSFLGIVLLAVLAGIRRVIVAAQRRRAR